MRLRWWTVLGAAVATLALFAAACGGGDDDEAGDDGAATATADSGDDGDDGGDEETPEATIAEGDDDNGDDSSADAIDVCALVTKDEAEAALGAPVGDGEAQGFPPIYNCRYQTEDFDILDVTVVVYDDDETAEAAYEMVLDVNDYPEIGGLGERAYDSRPIGGVNVLQGRYELSVDVSAGESDEDFDSATGLAERAVDRLP